MKQPSMQAKTKAQCGSCGSAFALLWLAFAAPCVAQAQGEPSPQEEVARLARAVREAQARVEQSQKELADLQRSLQALQQRLATPAAGVSAASAPAQPASSQENASASAAGEELAERQALQQSELATLNQAKVESSSKYPVTLRGMILLNGFVNTAGVDIASTPYVALGGAGSTGASLRQTSLGIDARGPVLAGGRSYADLTMDFLGNAAGSVYADASGLVRLRTAHAGLLWQRTSAFAEFDRPLVSPNVPSSLVTIAQPTLAWSGNLWQWTPQAGVAHTVDIGSRQLSMEAALIDVPDPPALSSSGSTLVSSAESSRWPGAELHMELGGKGNEKTGGVGLGGYFSPHQISGSPGYNAWAGTLDLRSPQWAGLQLTGSVYRGLALGGLGGGVYKDIVSRQQNGSLVSRPLDDVGGWLQLKQRAGQRIEFNAALGMDQGFAAELRAYPLSNSLLYATLARNRTLFANTIWTPSAYLPFSFEYRRITSTPITGPAVTANLFGLAAGYVF